MIKLTNGSIPQTLIKKIRDAAMKTSGPTSLFKKVGGSSGGPPGDPPGDVVDQVPLLSSSSLAANLSCNTNPPELEKWTGMTVWTLVDE